MVSKTIGIAGVKSSRTATPRRIFLTEQGQINLPKAVIINGALSRDPGNTGDKQYLRAGMPMGKITATGKYAPSVIGLLAADHDSAGTTLTTLTVPVAAAVELQRRIADNSGTTFNLIGPPSAGGTVATTTVTFSAIDTATGAVTITDIAVDKQAGSLISPTDGSEIPLCLIGDGYPLKVTDEDEVSVDIPANGRLFVGGVVDSTQILLGDSTWASADASTKEWIMSSINGGAAATPAQGPMVFDHLY